MRLVSLLPLAAALISGVSAGPIESHTFIEPGKQFVLGGQQQGAFEVRLRNSGPVPVSVAERRPNGVVQECGRLEPCQTAVLNFEAGSAALVRNLGTQQAEFNAVIKGKTSGLGMTYEALKK